METGPVIFGEVLFDVFPDGHRVLGGAPFNVAWHLQAFGAGPLLITRVGDDDPGREILARMGAWGMSTEGVQVDPTHPTGRVRVNFHKGEPSFEIEAEQSFDFVEPDPARSAVESMRPGMLYHGSLAIRSQTSWKALKGLYSAEAVVVCDLNIRDPWWTRERLDWCLDGASWIKLSDHELSMLTSSPTASRDQCLEAARGLAQAHTWAGLVVTRGGAGVIGLFEDGEEVLRDAPSPAQMVDTVGAGDAFSAVLILGILRGWDRPTLLENAVRFARDVCEQRGATANDPSLYRGKFP